MITYQIEAYSDFKHDLDKIAVDQYEEVNVPMKLNINHAYFELIHSTGNLFVMTARDDKKLIGYIVYIIDNHTQYSDNICAFNQAVYVIPKYRMSRVALKLIRYAEEFLIESYKVDAIICSSPTKGVLDRLLDRLEYKPLETSYIKYIDRG